MAYKDIFVSQGSKGGLWENIRTIVYAVLIALLVRTFAYEPFNIPSKSMLPTLLVGDYLFVSKYSYGYSRYSMPLGVPLVPQGTEGRIFFSGPERGDVVVFKLPTDNKTDYIKRIIGLPGDEIQMREGRLYINRKLVEREQIGGYTDVTESGVPLKYRRYSELLPNGRKHVILELSDDAQLDNTPVFKVPARHYFAMGDNRDNSADSRVMRSTGFPPVGYIPAENLVGRAEFLFFSIDSSAAFWEIWKWPGAIRWERLFDAVSP